METRLLWIKTREYKPRSLDARQFDCVVHVIHFGIVTPTYKRARFLPSFIRNVRRQTYTSWTLAIVHDGPGNVEVAAIVNRAAAADCRIRYLETPVHKGDMGNGPRIVGIENLAATMAANQYILFWDDDNLFFKDALANIEGAIQKTGQPDLLLVPIKHKGRPLPAREIPLRSFPLGGVDAANLCVKTEMASKYYASSQHVDDAYHQDFYFYRSICDDKSTTVGLANINNIGCYDGLRLWESVRWKIYPWPLRVYDTFLMRQLRQRLPRG